MKLTVEPSHLRNALKLTGRCISPRHSLPILANVHTEATENHLTLIATDLDTTIEVRIPAQTSEQGAVALPYDTTRGLLDKLADAAVTLETQDGKVSVSAAKSSYLLLSLPAEDYPATPSIESETSITVGQATLKRLLRRVSRAASKEESRSILMGVLFELEPDGLNLVATDTHRLVACHYAPPDPFVGGGRHFIVPAKALGMLIEMLGDTDDDVVEIIWASSLVCFEMGETRLSTRLLDGQFPNYQKVIPKTENAVAVLEFEREALLSTLNRIYVVARANAEKTLFAFDDDDQSLSLRAESSDVGRASESLPIRIEARDAKGHKLEIAFNTRYLIELLSSLDDDVMEMYITGSLNPACLQIKGGRDGYKGIVMPMQV